MFLTSRVNVSYATSMMFLTAGLSPPITTFGGGLNYFKLNASLANIRTIFKDKATEKVYGGYVNHITEDARGNVWMAGSNTLIEWNPETGETCLHWHNKIDEQDHRGFDEREAPLRGPA